MKYWILTLSLLIFMSMQNARARGLFTPSASVIQLPDSIQVSGNAADGSIIWKSSEVHSTLTNGPIGWGPDLAEAQIYGTILSYAEEDGDLFATINPGIAARWKAIWRAPNFPAGVTMSINDPSQNSAGPSGYQYDSSYVQTVWLEFVKTGAPVRQGPLSFQAMATVEFYCDISTCRSWDITLSGNPVISTTPSCSAEPVPRVEMPRWILGGDSQASQTTGFKIVLICTGGDTDNATRPLVTLTDANERSNTSTILTLTPVAETAQGIGIQILRNGQPLPLGPENGTAHQWQAGSVGQGISRYEIPLEARYVRTGSAVSPGYAKARAIFTLNYQ